MAVKFIFIRHGEKPSDEDDHNLSPEGYLRSLNLATKMPFDKAPTFIVAPKPRSKIRKIPDIFVPPEFHSLEELTSFFAGCGELRALQTVIPLAKKIPLPIQCDCTTDDVEGIVKKLVGIEKEYGMQDDEVVVLTCWEHKAMGKIVKKLLKALNQEETQQDESIKYPGSQFNLKWHVDRGEGESRTPLYIFWQDTMPF